MKRSNLRHRWLIMIAGILILAIALGGTALAKKKKGGEKGWLGVYIHDVDEEIMEAWDLDTDDGVIVDDIIDDSPAEEAGLEPGDIIIKFGGQTVTSSNRLTKMIRVTKPDTEVKIEILRDGEPQELTVILGERERDYAMYFNDDDYFVDIPRIRIPDIPSIPDLSRIAPHTYRFYGMGSRGRIGIQLHDLNEQLGEYFGITKGHGVLVEKVLDDSPAAKAGIKAGDVIVKIGGEEVLDADDVVDEISDLDEGDEIEITVLRKGSEQSFTVEIEEDGSWSDERRVVIRKSGKTFPRVRHFTWEDEPEDDFEEVEEELREALEELREELKEVKEELQEVLEKLGLGE